MHNMIANTGMEVMKYIYTSAGRSSDLTLQSWFRFNYATRGHIRSNGRETESDDVYSVLEDGAIY